MPSAARSASVNDNSGILPTAAMANAAAPFVQDALRRTLTIEKLMLLALMFSFDDVIS